MLSSYLERLALIELKDWAGQLIELQKGCKICPRNGVHIKRICTCDVKITK